MNIKINGEIKDVKNNISIVNLLNELHLSEKPVVFELNREIIIKESYNKKLNEGDEVEIVTFVGGG